MKGMNNFSESCQCQLGMDMEDQNCPKRQKVSVSQLGKENHWEGYVFMVKLVHLLFISMDAIYSDHKRKPLHQEYTTLVWEMSY